MPVARVQVQPAALRASQKHAPVLVGGDLFDMAEVHVLVVAAVVAASVIHAHEAIGHAAADVVRRVSGRRLPIELWLWSVAVPPVDR